MNRAIVVFALSLAISAFSGCARFVVVTVRSDPPLATIYQGSQNMGVAPTEIRYSLTEDHVRDGQANFQGLSARWVSGATATINSLDLNLANGRFQDFTFFRPQSAPGLEIDVQYVSNFQRGVMGALPVLLLLQQQQQQQQRQSRPTVPPYTPPPTYHTNCTRDSIGNVTCTTTQY